MQSDVKNLDRRQIQEYLNQLIERLDLSFLESKTAFDIRINQVELNLKELKSALEDELMTIQSDDSDLNRKSMVDSIKRYFFITPTYHDIFSGKVDRYLIDIKGQDLTKKAFFDKKSIQAHYDIYIEGTIGDYRKDSLLDFYSLLLGFYGFKDALNFNFDLSTKPLDQQNVNYFLTKVFGGRRPENPIIPSSHEDKPEGLLKKLRDDLKELIPTELSDDLVDKWLEKNKVNQQNQARSYPDEFIKELFSEIINLKAFPDRLVNNKVALLFNPSGSDLDFDWPHRAVLASGLSLSLLNGWDENKIYLLKKLLERKEEPLVYERAIIGVTLALIVSHSHSWQYQKTLEEFSIYRTDERFKAGIFFSMEAFLKKLETYSPSDGKTQLLSIIKPRYQFQFFEPFHSQSSFIRWDNLDFQNDEQKDEFFSLLNQSSLLNNDDLLKMAVAERKIDKEIISKLIGLFNKEQIFRTKNDFFFEEFDGVKYVAHIWDRINGDFLRLLGGVELFYDHWTLLRAKIKRVDFKIFKTTSEIFPYTGWKTILETIEASIPTLRKLQSVFSKRLVDDTLSELAYYEGAIEYFSSYIDSPQDKPWAFRKIAISQIALGQEKNDKDYYYKALDNINKSLEFNYSHKEANLIAARCSLLIAQSSRTIEDFNLAGTYIDKLIALDERSDELTYYAAYCWYNIGQLRKDASSYRKAIKYIIRGIDTSLVDFNLLPLFGKEQNFHLMLAICWVQLGSIEKRVDHYLEAIKVYKQYIKDNEQHFDFAKKEISICWMQIGGLLVEEENYAEGIEAYEKSIETKFLGNFLYRQMAFAYLKLAVKQSSIEFYLKAIQYLKNYEKMEKAIDVSNQICQSWYNLALLSGTKEYLLLARNELLGYLKLDWCDIKKFLLLTGCLQKLSEVTGESDYIISVLDLSIKSISRCKDRKSISSIFISNCYSVDFETGKAKSEEFATIILSQDPLDLKLIEHVGLVWAQAETQRMSDNNGWRENGGGNPRYLGFQNALIYFKFLTHNDQNNDEFHYRLGMAHFLLEDVKQANACFEKALSLNGQNEMYSFYLGLCQLCNQNESGAISYFIKSVDLFDNKAVFFEKLEAFKEDLQRLKIPNDTYQSLWDELEIYVGNGSGE